MFRLLHASTTRLLDDIVYQVERINLIFQGSQNGFLTDYAKTKSTQVKKEFIF